MASPLDRRFTLDDFRRMKRDGHKFAMLTAYDYPTAVCAQAAGVPALLIGDSMGCVLLGHENTRGVPLELMITLGAAVRRGAPNVYLVGDIPYESAQRDTDGLLHAARRFREEAGCNAVKIETPAEHPDWIAALAQAGFEVIAHLGLRPQSVVTPRDYRAQARTRSEIETLVRAAESFVGAGAAMLLLEAVPNEAAQAVAEATDAPLIGCGAGPACDGHVCVTQDMLGLGADRLPRFVPKHADLRATMEQAMRRWITDIENQTYPGPEHVYGMLK